MRPPAQSPARSITLAVGTLLACSGSTASTLPVETEVRARALAPGEPARIVVTAPAPLRSVAARFLDQEVALVRATGPGSSGGERWSGWAIIALEQPAGGAVVEVSGESADGRPVAGTLAVTIEPREFPTEKLSVAPKYVTPPPEVERRLAAERAKLAEIYRSRQPFPPPGEPFIRPVPGGPSSVFGTRRVYNGEPRSPHPGLDLRATSGTPVHASGPGKIVLAQELYYSGNTVIVDHGGGLFTLYAHLSAIQVREGNAVEQGQVVGLSGATGRVTGPHLHWGAKIGNRPFDPLALTDRSLFR